MANCFFIDFENVHNAGLSNLKGLSKDDLFFIFYTANAESITLDNISLLNKSCCRYDLIKVPAGSQSLDMHLISYVGYAVGIHGNKYNYVVISKDKDYDNIISFWKEKCGISIKRQASINGSSVKTTTTSSNTNSDKQSPIIKESPAKTLPQNDDAQNSIDSQPKLVQNVDEKPASGIDQEIEKLLLNSGYPQSLVQDVNKVISDGIKEEMALSSIHCNLKNLTEDFHAVYELVKPLVKKQLKSIAPEKCAETKNTSNEPTLNEKVQKVLKEKNYSGEIFNSVASIVCKNQKEKNVKLLVYRTLVAKYGQDKGLELYRHVKPLL